MCGRVVFPGSESIVKELGLIYNDEVKTRQLNAPPGSQVPVILNSNSAELRYCIWSIIPKYSITGKPDWKYHTFNAKVENLLSSNMWKPLIGKQHCIFITNGFYEWQLLKPKEQKSPKQVYYIKEKTSPFTFMAGLWDLWHNKVTG